MSMTYLAGSRRRRRVVGSQARSTQRTQSPRRDADGEGVEWSRGRCACGCAVRALQQSSSWTLRAAPAPSRAVSRSPAERLRSWTLRECGAAACGRRPSGQPDRISSAAGRREYERKKGVGRRELVHSSTAGRWAQEQQAGRLGVS
jgi:hypothetical protein